MKKNFLSFRDKKLPVNKKKYLLDILNPTSKGTKYYDTPPNYNLNERQVDRIFLQCHQFCSIMLSLGINIKGKNLLDIGTGNGMVPRFLLDITKLKSAVGIDPYLDGEHKTSWQKHNHKDAQIKLKNLLKKAKKSKIDIDFYKKFLKFENFSFIPQPMIFLKKTLKKKYIFKNIGADHLKKLNKKFDIVYCKAIEHIPNWKDIFKNISSVSKKGTIVYFKHRSFFSYLGAHRYSSTFIPWGHLLLNDKEIRKYATIYHKSRKKDFLNFYFKGLTYPRTTVNELITIAQSNGFALKGIQIDKPKHLNRTIKYIKKIKNFWNIIWKNYPRVSADEVLSGIYHIVLEKV